MRGLEGALARSIAFVQWANFVDPRVWAIWASGLALLLVAAWVFWSLGDLLTPRHRREASGPGPSPLESLVVRTLGGMGLAAVILFPYALLGWYRPRPVLATAAAAMVLAALRRRDPIAFLRVFGPAVRAEWPLWTFAALCSLRSLLPPMAWDELMIHYAYAEQWVRAGRLTVDPFAWYPLYTFNWQLLQGVALMVGSETLGHLFAWLAGTLGAFCILLFLQRFGVRCGIQRAAALAFLVTPLTQNWLNTGYADVPMMAMLAVATFTLWRLNCANRPTPSDALLPATCAAMFVGMKVTCIFYGPAFLGLAALRLRRRTLLTYVSAVCILGAPWYVRNLVLSGDPAPPLLSSVLHRTTEMWSAEDIAWVNDQIRSLGHRPADLARIPLRALRGMQDTNFPDGSLLGYVLLFPLSLSLARRLWRQRNIEPLAMAWWGTLVWIGTSYLLRYCVFLPLMVVCAALVVARALELARTPALVRRWGWAVAAALLLGPTLDAVRSIKGAFSTRVPTSDSARWALVRTRVPEVQSLDALSARASAPSSVYLTQIGLRYHYQRRGFRVVGNMFHRGRFRDFRSAVESQGGAEFLRNLGAEWLIVDRRWTDLYLGIHPDSLSARLARDPQLTLVYKDSAGTIFHVATSGAGAAGPVANAVGP